MERHHADEDEPAVLSVAQKQHQFQPLKKNCQTRIQEMSKMQGDGYVVVIWRSSVVQTTSKVNSIRGQNSSEAI